VLCFTSCALCTTPVGCVVISFGSFYCNYVIVTCIGLRACVLYVVVFNKMHGEYNVKYHIMFYNLVLCCDTVHSGMMLAICRLNPSHQSSKCKMETVNISRLLVIILHIM
jgi:hypothetical protein